MARLAAIQARPLVMRQFFLTAISVRVPFAAAVDATRVAPAPRWRVVAHPPFALAFALAFAANTFASFEGAARADKG